MGTSRTNQDEIPAYVRKKSTLNEVYSNPSMIEKSTEEDKSRCKLFSFVVEWQMHNTSVDS